MIPFKHKEKKIPGEQFSLLKRLNKYSLLLLDNHDKKKETKKKTKTISFFFKYTQEIRERKSM